MEGNNKTTAQFPKKYKFLRRTAVIDNDLNKILTKVKLKRVYLKEIKEKFLGEEMIEHLYPKGKVLNCLTELRLISLQKPHTINMIKRAKNLRDLQVDIPTSLQIQGLLRYLARINKNLQALDLFGSELNVRTQDVSRLYRLLGTLRNLKVLWRSLDYSDETKIYVPKEFKLIKRYIPRMKELKEFEYEQTEINQQGFQEIMKESQPCPWISDLSLLLAGEMFESYNRVSYRLEEETSDAASEDEENEWSDEDNENASNEEADEGSSEDNNSSIDSDREQLPASIRIRHNALNKEEELKIIKEEMIPFFKFSKFTNLKKLRIIIADDCLYHLDSFVIDGYESLRKLEQFTLILESRPFGTKFLLEGLLKLPILSRFSLEIPFLNEDEVSILAQFFTKQTQLVYLSFCISGQRTTKSGYQRQKFYIENLWQFLNNKPNLRYLVLKSNYWSLESISQTLKKTTITNQLIELEIHTFDDCTTLTPPLERIEGLSDFIGRQKETLRCLIVTTNFVTEENIVKALVKAISGLEKLQELAFRINSEPKDVMEEYNTFFDKVLGKKEFIKNQEGFSNFNNCYCEIGESFKQLSDLRELLIDLRPMKQMKGGSDSEAGIILDMLPSFKALKILTLNLPSFKDVNKIKSTKPLILFELERIISIDIRTSGNDKLKHLRKVMKQVNEKQSLRCDLMF